MIPPVLRGAFIKVDAGLLGFLPNVLVFQFNPETVSRSPGLPQPPPKSDGSGPRDTGAQPGEPAETISFTLRMDATDQLAEANPIAAASGILPQLSALELLLYPKPPPSVSLAVPGAPSHTNPPAKLSTVLFFWGPFRVLPVNITGLSIQETEYDQLLTPIRAEVSVTLTVLTPSVLAEARRFERGAYNYTQKAREVLAAVNLINPPDFLTRSLSTL